MHANPILHTAEMFVEIHKDDLAEFRKIVKSKQPPCLETGELSGDDR